MLINHWFISGQLYASSVCVWGINTGLPNIASPDGLSISGPTGGTFTIQRDLSNLFRLFIVNAGASLSLSNLTLRNGNVSGFGGAVNNGGTLQMTDCSLIGNTAGNQGGALSNFGGVVTITRCKFDNNGTSSSVTTADGGAIANTSNGSAVGMMTVTDSTFTNNRAGTGGGIFNSGQLTVRRCYLESNSAQSSATGTSVGGGAIRSNNNLTLENSTLLFNSAQTNGGGVLNESVFSLQNCTLVANAAPNGGGVFNAGDSTNIGNTLFVRNPQGVNVLNGGTVGSFVSDGYNLSDDASGPATATDKRNTDPMIDAIADFNGGPTKTIGLQPGSPAIDAGKSALPTDQRGQLRPVDFRTVANAPGGNGSDIGSFEAAGTPSLLVNIVADEDNNSSDPAAGAGTSLREAINRANSDGVNSVINFAPNVFGGARQTLTLGGTQLFAGANGTLALNTPGRGLTLSGNNASRILEVDAGADVTLSNLTFTLGKAPDTLDGGGAIRVVGTLSASN